MFPCNLLPPSFCAPRCPLTHGAGEGWVAEELTFSASSKRSYTLDKVVSVFTSHPWIDFPPV